MSRFNGKPPHMKVLIPSEPDQSPFPVAKFQLFTKFLSEVSQLIRIRIPETLVKNRGQSEELYFTEAKSGAVMVERQRCGINRPVETLLAAVRRAAILEGRDSPFHFPMMIAYLPGQVQMLFSESDLLKIVSVCPDFVVQRYLPSSQHRATKHRVHWTSISPISVFSISSKHCFPYNDPPAFPRLKARRKSHYDSHFRHTENTQQLRFPNLLAGSRSNAPGGNTPKTQLKNFSTYAMRAMQQVECPYVVSFGQGEYSPDESQSEEATEAANALVSSLQSVFSLYGLHLTSLSLDLLHSSDSHWYCLDLKSYTSEAVDEKIREKLRSMGRETKQEAMGSPLRSALEELKSFFLSEKPLSDMKAPYIDKNELVSGNVKLYRRFSLY